MCGGNPFNFSVLPWSMPKSLENFVPEYSRFFVYDNFSLFFAWRSNLSIIFTFRHGKESLSSQKPIQNQVISSVEPILDILLIDHCLYFVSPSGLFQVLSSPEYNTLPSKVLKNLYNCKTFLLKSAFHLSHTKRILSVTATSESSRFAAITSSLDSGTLNAELYSVSQTSTSPAESHLEFSSNICSDSSSQNTEICTCHFLMQGQASTFFSDCKDADVLLVGLSTGELFCIPILMTARKLGIRPTPRLIFQSHWSIIGLTCTLESPCIFVFLKGGTGIKISPLLNESSNSSGISLSYSSFTLSHSVKYYSALTSDQLIISDAFNTSLIHILPPDQTQVEMISIRGITAMSPLPKDSLIIASTSHNVFYLLNPASSLHKEDQSHLPWTGCDLDFSLQLVQDMKAQTAILSQLKSNIKEEDCLIKALSAVSRSSLMAKFFTLTVKVFTDHEEQSVQSSEEAIDFNDCQENNNQKFVASIQVNNTSPEVFPSSLWKMGIEFRSSDGLVATKNISLSRTFSTDSPFCARFNMPFAIEVSSLPLQVKTFLLAEIKEDGEKSDWLKMSLASAVLDISHFVSVLSQAPQSQGPEVHDIADCINQIHSAMSDFDSQTDEQQEKTFVSCVVLVPEEFRQHNLILDKILSNCTKLNVASKEKYFYNQSDKTVIWLKFLHKTLSLVFRKSCLSITVCSAHLDFFHSFKLHLTSIFKEDCKSDCGTEHNVAVIKAKNLKAVLETLSLEDPLDHKKLLAVYQDLRNNVSPQMY